MGAVAAGAGVYAAIRSDLTRSIVTAEQAAAAATKAHDRLDVHVQNHHC
jgi:protein-L-isoaspartate O-methyltransferase